MTHFSAQRALIGIGMVAATMSVPAVAQPSAAMQRANALVGARQFAQAASLLDSIIKVEPQNAQARLALGAAEAGLGQVDRAAATYQSVIVAFPRAAPLARQSLFLLYAGTGRADEAFTWYGQLRNTIDLSGVASNAEVAKLAADERFAEVMPGRINFENPFVEGTRIIHEWRGEAPGDEFGWIARPVGDVDHDGVTDVVISAPAHAPLGDNAGKLYLFSGKTGRIVWKHQGTANALLGTGVEAAGDVNHDGVPDVIAGAPGTNEAFVLSGADGRILHTMKGEPNEYYFGNSVAGVGDVNGDGYDDVIVGAPYAATTKGRAAGRAIVFSGKDGGRLLVLEGEGAGDRFGSAVGSGGAGQFIVGAAAGGAAHTGRLYKYSTLSTVPAFTADPAGSGAQFGAMFISVIGDLDGDQVPDIYATDFGDTAMGPATGRVYVFSGKTGKMLRNIAGDTPREGFGIGAARTGDVDGDGIPDLVVGSYEYDGAAWSGGRVRVLSGKDGHVLQAITGRVPGETLGFDAVGVGDVDGDGLADYLVTSAYSMVNGVRAGRAFIVAGTVRKH